MQVGAGALGRRKPLVVSLCLGNEGMKGAVESVPGTKLHWRWQVTAHTAVKQLRCIFDFRKIPD